MQVLWSIGQGTVQDVRDQLDNLKPARTTVATVLSILETKGFVNNISAGRINIYVPVVGKEAYSKSQLFGLLKNYFNDSFASMASFFAKENNYSVEELDSLLEDTRKELEKEKHTK